MLIFESIKISHLKAQKRKNGISFSPHYCLYLIPRQHVISPFFSPVVLSILNIWVSPFLVLTLLVPETKIAEFANSVDLDEVAYNEPPHLNKHGLPSSLLTLNIM